LRRRLHGCRMNQNYVKARRGKPKVARGVLGRGSGRWPAAIAGDGRRQSETASDEESGRHRPGRRHAAGAVARPATLKAAAHKTRFYAVRRRRAASTGPNDPAGERPHRTPTERPTAAGFRTHRASGLRRRRYRPGRRSSPLFASPFFPRVAARMQPRRRLNGTSTTLLFREFL